MKYMQQGGFKHHPLMRLTLSFTLFFLLGFWLTNIGMYFSKMNLNPHSVIEYYLGNPELQIPGRSFDALLETSHFHLPMMALIVLVLTHLIIFIPIPESLKKILIYTAFLSALFQEGSSWLIVYLSPLFSITKIGGFLVLQSLILIMILALGKYLWDGNKKNQSHKK